tara:strand:- start:104 stop:265 length:162 start_codon:yes stop_codon:yes gene_type:complete
MTNASFLRALKLVFAGAVGFVIRYVQLEAGREIAPLKSANKKSPHKEWREREN